MKYVAALILGLISGIVVVAAAMYFNPMTGRPKLSPLAVDSQTILSLNYAAASSQSILVSNDGNAFTQTHPAGVAELWEPAVEQTQLRVVSLRNGRGQSAGIGVKVTSPSEETEMHRSRLLADSVWHLYLPGRGTFAVYQQEDYWSYLRDVVVPAWRSPGESWRGTWNRNMTIGPNALGTANVYGLSGIFDGLQSEAVESLNARAYSVSQGPVSMDAALNIVLPSDKPTVADSGE